ncbi:MAG: hypothetical protein EBR01_12845 [Proteobacteria bacterium]|nr:hypothetical protein [Pseudomonadota bacterium]
MSVVFKNGYADGFAFAVPEAFAESLKQEKFNQGDVFYDSPEAYKLEWGKYLKKAKTIIQVSGYDKSDLKIKILKPDKEKTEIVEAESRTVSSEQLFKILKEGL